MIFPKKKQEMKKKAHKASILQDRKECYITKKRTGVSVCIGLEEHHIYAGRNREISEAHGFKVWLLPEYHRTSLYAVHGKYGASLDLELKKDCQRDYEAKGHSREEFVKLIGRSYL